ncbi:hypothetical protein O7626_17815 [Micromonospora sp. WMMD1102]|uniref:hypothetical protein n=1 Tax=Micromonospora sp. WMMD1102 TaxID=3016105 RepID=UPI0024152E26|nr:hypothetical protein [Micromonospora sp. WMMD1102]MDG4787772.1 hypothetical protein [Micromonospora sp. WMMD1102]
MTQPEEIPVSRRWFLRLGALLGAGGVLPTGISEAGAAADPVAPVGGPPRHDVAVRRRLLADPSDPAAFLDPVALDGSPGQAFASHRARANGIARYVARTRKLSTVHGAVQADEDMTFALLAHLHAVADDPDFAVDGVASRTELPLALRRLTADDGKVGTNEDYDSALKGLIVVLYRYRHLLPDEIFDFVLDELVPDHMSGGHPREIELVNVFPLIDVPESENHLLMIESTRYLVNQLLHDRTGDARFDNEKNGLTGWLLGYLQTIARHDFHEFNARPYARYSLHALYNLHEFAREQKIRTAAQILLDYTMVKFAVSSVRGRRVSPHRRHQDRINHHANERDDLYAESGDQVAGFFLSYTGLLDAQDHPVRFPASLTLTALISSTAAYRPPPAAYILAMEHDHPEYLHRFHHGTRPRPRGSTDSVDAGVEIYFRSPSFLISAGGAFQNGGYGYDEYDFGKNSWRGTSRAQATTLIPTRVDTRFHELVRFEPYPDPIVDPYVGGDPENPDAFRAEAVNIGVHRRIAAGANLRPAEKRTIAEHSTSTYPALASHAGRLWMAWKGSGNDQLNIGRVQYTTLFDIDGVEGVEGVVTLGDSTDRSPALASHGGRLFLAWRGSGNDHLNLACWNDGGNTLVGTTTLGDSSDHSPALVSHGGRLFLAWTGQGGEELNVARVVLVGNTAGGFGIDGIEDKVVLAETSSHGPALASHGGRLFLAWKGSGNDNLNLNFSDDDGRTFHGTRIFPETSQHAPTLASHGGRLRFGWAGRDEQLNVARVVLVGNTAGGFAIDGLEGNVVLGEISTRSPALTTHDGRLFLGWKGEGDDNLNLRVSMDGTFGPVGPWMFKQPTGLGLYLAVYRTPPARPDDLDVPPDNLALVYAMESDGMDFGTFQALTESRNTHLPARLDLDGTYDFHAPDGRDFTIWFSFVGQKYDARIVDRSDPLTNLGTLPLVSGEFLRAPGGHDGLVEIRHPGGEQAPVVLDFRDAATPALSDNRAAIPLPWIERGLSFFALVEKFEQEERRGDARLALADAVRLYDQMLRLNPARNGPPFAPAVVRALGNRGVDFSVAEADLRDWLANPHYTPYPAISQALLLSGWRLRAPVCLDVIVWNYERTRGVASPRTVAAVQTEVLKAAILEGFNNRHGTRVRHFEELLLP